MGKSSVFCLPEIPDWLDQSEDHFVLVLDSSGFCRYGNYGLTRLLGFDNGWKDVPASELFSDSTDAFWKNITCSDHTSRKSPILISMNASSAAIPVRWEFSPLFGSTSQLIGCIGIGSRIHDNITIGYDLAFHTLAEHAFDGVFIFHDYRLEYVNQSLANLSGYDVPILTSPSFDLESIFTEQTKQVVRKNHEVRQAGYDNPHTYALEIIKKSGDILELEATTVPVIHNNAKKIIGILRDVTEENRFRTNAEHAFSLVNKQQHSLGEFTHAISHDIRAHASNLQGLAHLLPILWEPLERQEIETLLRKVSGDLMESIHKLNNTVNASKFSEPYNEK